MPFRRERDPVDGSTEWVDATGLNVHWQMTGAPNGSREGVKVVMQRLSPCDHHKGSAGMLSLRSCLGKAVDALLGVGFRRP